MLFMYYKKLLEDNILPRGKFKVLCPICTLDWVFSPLYIIKLRWDLRRSIIRL